MPYITEDRRKLYDDYLEAFDFMHAKQASAGDMTYFITALLHRWIKSQKWGYLTMCISMGILFCTALELYRKVIAPYEAKKRIENGGVSILDEKTLEDVR